MQRYDVENTISDLIYLKDKLKEDGYSWRDYECINDACNQLEELAKYMKQCE